MPRRPDVCEIRAALADRLPSRPVGVFYCYVLSRSLAFTVPIYVIFYQSRGLSLAQFGLLEATYTVAVLGFEFPTGYLADRVGRRNGLALANALGAVGAVGYALAHSFPAFLAAVVVRAVGATFSSGASDAWLYELLAAESAEAEFARVSGRARALGLAGQAGAALVGSRAYAVSHLLPWALDAAALIAGVGLLVAAVPSERAEERTATPKANENISEKHEETAESVGDTPDDSDHLSVAAAIAVTRTALARPRLRSFVAVTSLFLGVVSAALLFVQPVGVEVLSIDPARLGGVYAGLTFVSAVAASQTGRVESLVGVSTWFRVAPVLAAAGLLAVAVEPWVALPLFFVLRALAATSRPLADGRINDEIRSRGRASVLSTVSMLRSVAVAPLKLAAGALAVAALPTMLAALGAVLLVGVGLVALVGTRAPDAAETVRQSEANSE
ncbi:MFS transporter [Halorussus gelatinilyticus]|uniref:MFS transporter n=1 Tax=Halorussus gelatinilyticus TaxID=2937524 RepID=A0A8U0IKS9_9EURY|nr:MFS transporter [Halorussus gelatinilyticus]UPW00649.1 MFS transporter [Halorussus gelatinilyticus]